MTWTGPRCPHCERRMSTWGRVCCDCAMGNNDDDNKKGGEDAAPCRNVRSS